MCELLALSSLCPATLSISLHEFSRRGGITGHHVDGWGLAFYDEGDVRLIREPVPAAESPCIRMIEESGLTSRIILSHIRKATQGERCLRNTQPFVRELGGRKHTFAHNGDLSGVRGSAALPTSRYRPVGETDSEVAFCALLETLIPLWSATEPPPLAARLAAIEAFAAEVRPLGPANFIYSDGDYLFAHGHKRTQLDKEVRPPGLHVLRRACPAGHAAAPSAGVTIAPCPTEQQVALIASVPLTDNEDWVALEEGQVMVFAGGRDALA